MVVLPSAVPFVADVPRARRGPGRTPVAGREGMGGTRLPCL